MPKAKPKSPPSVPSEEVRPDEDFREEEAREAEVETGGNGHSEIEDEPATMQVTIKGTAKGVRAAAKNVAGGETAPRPATSEDREPPEDDENATLLADPKNMIVVSRQLPRVYQLRSGEEVRCAVKVEKYTCPITRDEIENDVFDRFGGRKYKATIHPNTTTGENTILGAFTIEHSNPNEPPYIEDPETPEEYAARVTASIPGGTDPTMRETDTMSNLKTSLERRLDRARQRKEIKELEKIVREEEENEEKPKVVAPVPSGPDPRDREIAELRARLEKKEIDDRFVALQTQIAETNRLIQTIANRPPPAPEPKSGGDDSLVIKLLNQSQQHAKDMIDLMKNVNRPAPVATSADGGVTGALDVISKVKGILGKDDSRASQLEEKILDSALDRMLDGGENSPEEEDTLKFAIRQMTPVLKTYVEKQVEKEERGDGKGGDKQPVTKERLKEIYAEAGAKAAREIAEKWQRDGLVVKVPPPGLPAPGKKAAIPPRSAQPGKVVARHKTAEGVVEHIKVEPADLTQKAAPKPSPAPAEPKHAQQEEVEEVKYTDMPGVGKVEIPARSGEMKYDRRKSVNYVLDSILSEISEGTPQKAAEDPKVESYVPSDALDYLDNELLSEVHGATSGDELEVTLGKWGDREKIDRIKEAGKDKIVDTWIRRAIRTIQDHWRDQQGG